jgi:hypothetical protein
MICPHCRQNNPDNQYNCSYCHQPLNVHQPFQQNIANPFSPPVSKANDDLKNLMVVLIADSILALTMKYGFDYTLGKLGLGNLYGISGVILRVGLIALCFYFVSKTKNDNVKYVLIGYAAVKFLVSVLPYLLRQF